MDWVEQNWMERERVVGAEGWRVGEKDGLGERWCSAVGYLSGMAMRGVDYAGRQGKIGGRISLALNLASRKRAWWIRCYGYVHR